MALNFPANPAAQTPVNTYSPTSTPFANTDNNLTYVFDGVKWGTTGSPPFLLNSGGTMTGPLTVPTLTATDTTTGSLITGSLNGGPLAGMRNRIINGDMRIDQRAAISPIATTTSAYTVDRWQLHYTNAGGVQVSQSNAAPANFTNSLLFDITGPDVSVGASDYALLMQKIEGFNISDLGWGTSSAQTTTLSFWVMSTTPGIYCAAIRNGAMNRSYVAEYSISSANIWEKKIITIPGDTIGAWSTINGVGMEVIFTFQCGATYQTSPNSWKSGNHLATSNQTNLYSSASNEIRITGVQFEPGTVATPFERRSFGTEASLCFRYFSNNAVYGGGWAGGAGNYRVGSTAITPMRTIPTIIVSSSSGSNVNGQVADMITSVLIGFYSYVPVAGAFHNNIYFSASAEL